MVCLILRHRFLFREPRLRNKLSCTNQRPWLYFCKHRVRVHSCVLGCCRSRMWDCFLCPSHTSHRLCCLNAELPNAFFMSGAGRVLGNTLSSTRKANFHGQDASAGLFRDLDVLRIKLAMVSSSKDWLLLTPCKRKSEDLLSHFHRSTISHHRLRDITPRRSRQRSFKVDRLNSPPRFACVANEISKVLSGHL